MKTRAFRRWGAAIGLTSLLLGFASVAAGGGPPRPGADVEERLRALEEEVRQLRAERDAARREAVEAKPAAEEVVDKPAVEAIVDDKLKKQKVLAGWKDGFFLESPNGDFKLKLRGYAQADARFFPFDEGDTGQDSFFLRRVRPIFEGTRLQALRVPHHARLRRRHDGTAGWLPRRHVLPLGVATGRQVQGAVQSRASAVGRRVALHRALDLAEPRPQPRRRRAALR